MTHNGLSYSVFTVHICVCILCSLTTGPSLQSVMEEVFFSLAKEDI